MNRHLYQYQHYRVLKVLILHCDITKIEFYIFPQSENNFLPADASLSTRTPWTQPASASTRARDVNSSLHKT